MKIFTKTLNAEQLNTIKTLAEGADVLPSTASVLYKRGIDTVEKANKFLRPSKQNFINPFLLSGVSEAVKRIESAKINNETVVVYGDYDVDGICATTVLTKSLELYGINAVSVIPERDNGYGLQESVLNEVLESVFPDLIITVDCGISGNNEVEYLKDLGVDVIVTDHHELQGDIPNCIVINCKIVEQEYPFDALCGAGVAYKLAYALIGEKANNFLDLVAVATIADSMPLISENRDIVFEGIEQIKRGNVNKALRILLELASVKDVTASSIAFSIAPRINAAGRMGNARMALELMLSTDEDEMRDICAELIKLNVDRQAECDNLIKEVKRSLQGEEIRKVVVASGEGWRTGLVGIVTAKISEEYNLPAILFSEKDGILHGSARSIEGVNVFEAISYAKDVLVDFGGHAQAAGVTIKKENLHIFKNLINEYVENNYCDEVFERVIEVEEVISNKFSMRFAKELALLEPYGNGNKKPLFAVKGDNLNASKIKPDSTHISITGMPVDLMYFNGVSNLDLLLCDVTKYLVFEPNISTYNGREYLKGFVKNVVVENSYGLDTYIRSFIKALNGVSFKNYSGAVSVDTKTVKNILNDNKPSGFGTMFVLSNPENAKYFDEISKYSVNVLKLTERGGKNVVMIGGIPENDDFSAYTNLVYLDTPICVEKYVNFKTVTVNSEIYSFNLDNLTTDRGTFGAIFKNISALTTSGSYKTLSALYKEMESRFNVEQFAFAVSVFLELEFLTYNGVYSVNAKTKKELTSSSIYTGVSEKLC